MTRRRFVSTTVRRIVTVLALGGLVAATAFGLQAQAGEDVRNVPHAKEIQR